MQLNCLICYELCRKPVSCLTCNKILCAQHLNHLRNRCPNCRAEPFLHKRQNNLDQRILQEKLIEREREKKYKIFNCLVEGCVYSGKFHAMVKHRRRVHYEEKIEEIIYPQERAKKRHNQQLQQLIQNKISTITARHIQITFFIYTCNFGQCNLYTLIKMIKHLENCSHDHCKRIIVQGDKTFIGGEAGLESQCDSGKLLSQYYFNDI